MILVTHTDLDGIGCEIVARYFYPSLERVYHCSYDNVDHVVRKVLHGTACQLIVTDISVSEKTAIEIEQQHSQRVKIYDHHQTAKEYLDKYQWAVVDVTRSATQIFFDIMSENFPDKPIPKNLQQLVFHIDDYDLWHHRSPESKYFNGLLTLLERELFTQIFALRINTEGPLLTEADYLYLQGLENVKQKYFAERVKQSVVIDDRLVIIASRYSSELSQYIRDISPAPEAWQHIKYVDIVNFETGTHSLRSYDPEFDVSEVAKQRGGGGHPRAAGYPLQKAICDNSWLEDV